jgi:hypothetical protein
MARPGCGPIGCLFRLIGWILGLVVLVVALAALVVAGIYVSSPAPVREGPDRFLTENSVGYLQMNLIPEHVAACGLLKELADSALKNTLNKSTARTPSQVRPLVRGLANKLRADVLQNALPYAAFDLMSQGAPEYHITSVWAADLQLRASMLSLIDEGWDFLAPVGKSQLQGRSQVYRVHKLNHMLTTAPDNWLLLSDSPNGLSSALDGNGNLPIPESFTQYRALTSDTADFAIVLDNRREAIRQLMSDSRAGLLKSSQPADRDIVNFVFDQASRFPGQILGVAGDGWFVTPDSAQFQLTFILRSELSANDFRVFLNLLRSVIASGLARSGMTLRYDTRQEGTRVIIDLRLAGFRKPLLQALAGK